VKTRSRGSIRT